MSENRSQPSLDTTITNQDNSKVVSLITDGSTERLAVDTKISGVTNIGNSGKCWSGVINGIIIGGTNEADYVLIKNPSSSGKIFQLLQLNYSNNADTLLLKMYRDPTITSNGTSVSLVNFVKGGASTVLELYYTPTISVRGTIIFVQSDKKSINEINLFSSRPIQPGESLLITSETGSGKTHYVTFAFGEA